MIYQLIVGGMLGLIFLIIQKMNYARVGKRARDIEDLEWTVTLMTLISLLVLLGIFL